MRKNPFVDMSDEELTAAAKEFVNWEAGYCPWTGVLASVRDKLAEEYRKTDTTPYDKADIDATTDMKKSFVSALVSRWIMRHDSVISMIKQACVIYDHSSKLYPDSAVEINVSDGQVSLWDYSEEHGGSEFVKFLCNEDEVEYSDLQKMCNDNYWFLVG